jgi:hypothetical protein
LIDWIDCTLEQLAQFAQLPLGTIVSGTVTAKTAGGITVDCQGLSGEVRVAHLSDYPTLASKMHKVIQTGAMYVNIKPCDTHIHTYSVSPRHRRHFLICSLENLVVIGKIDAAHKLLLSRKQSLLTSVQQLGVDHSTAVDDVDEEQKVSATSATKRAKVVVPAFQVGEAYNGFVAKLLETGLVVTFIAPAIASIFVHKGHLSDRYVSTIETMFAVGQVCMHTTVAPDCFEAAYLLTDRTAIGAMRDSRFVHSSLRTRPKPDCVRA